jgi:hypothetical protein
MRSVKLMYSLHVIMHVGGSSGNTNCACFRCNGKNYGALEFITTPNPHKQEMSQSASFTNDAHSSAVEIISVQEDLRSTLDTLFGHLYCCSSDLAR